MNQRAGAGNGAIWIGVLTLLAGLGLTGEAAAQSGSTVTIANAAAGKCTVVLDVKTPRPGDEVGLAVDLAEFREQTVTGSTSELRFQVGSPLRPGTVVKARVNGTQVAMATVAAPKPGDTPDNCATPTAVSERSPFEATAFFGEVIDTFAPDQVGGYKNPEAGSAQKLRSAFGIQFDYRAVGSETSRVNVWFKGETFHGVRTADINCKPENPADLPPVCSKTSTYPERAKYILEHASSLEAYVSPRVEFGTLQAGTVSPARVYIAARLGFIALEEAPSVFKSFQLGLGLRASDGVFKDSYFEVGFGRNELFSDSHTKRLKIDGLLNFSLDAVPGIGESPHFFVEMLIDNNIGRGADSVQTVFGIDVDLKKAFGQ